MSQLVRRTAIALTGLVATAGAVMPGSGAARNLLGAAQPSAGVPRVEAPALPVPVPALPQVSAPPPRPPVQIPAAGPAPTLPRVAESIPAGGEVFQTASHVSYAPRAGDTAYAGAGTAPAAAGAPAVSSGSAPAAHQSAEAKEARVLRSRVTRLGRCFSALAPLERRLIALRAGMRGPPLSLAAAARAIHLPLARARRLETRARGEIAGLLRNGCETALRPTVETWAAPVSSSVPAAPVSVPVAMLTAGTQAPAAAAAPRPQQGVKGAEASSDAAPAPVPASAVPPTLGGSLVSGQLAGGSSTLPAAILAAAAPALLAAMILLLRGWTRREPQPAAAASPPEQRPPAAEPSSPLFINPAAAELIERHRARRREAGEDV